MATGAERTAGPIDAASPVATEAMLPGARTTLVVITLAVVINYVDRTALAALAHPIKQEFGLSDTQLGLLTGFGFALFYAAVGVPIARLADSRSRRTIIGVSIALWSLMTAACGLARSYFELFLARVGVGVGEAGCIPPAYSMLSDYFPPEKRGAAFGFMLSGTMVGLIGGFALGGWLGTLFGWRMAFVLIGLPGLLLSVVLFLLVREPPRRGVSGPPQSMPLGETLRLLARNRPYLWLIASQVMNSATITILMHWMSLFFIRSHGLSLEQMGLWFGVIFGVSLGFGQIAGGFMGDRLIRAGIQRPYAAATVTALLATPLVIAALLVPSVVLSFALMAAAALMMGLQSPVVVVGIQQVIDPRLRATAPAISMAIVAVIGLGLAPTMIGVLSDVLAPRFAGESLRWALILSAPLNLICAWVYWRTRRAVTVALRSGLMPA